MDNYKKKSLNFSRSLDNRELRAYRRSIDRRNIKHARLSALRGIDDDNNQLDNSLVEEKEKKIEVPSKKNESKVTNFDQRAEMLKKWKEEKDIKRKLQLKKPAFVVSRVTHKPNEFPQSKGLISKKGESKLSWNSTLSTSRIAPPKTGNLQHQSRLPKCLPSSSSVPRSAPARTVSQSANSKLPPSKPVVNRSVPKILNPCFKPQTSGPQNNMGTKINTSRNLRNGLASSSNASISHSRSAVAKPAALKPTNPLNSTTMPNIAKPNAIIKSAPAPTTPSRVPRSYQNTKSKSGLPSFAPTNFLFKTPVNVEKIIFPNGIPTFPSKQAPVRGNPEKKVNEIAKSEIAKKQSWSPLVREGTKKGVFSNSLKATPKSVEKPVDNLVTEKPVDNLVTEKPVDNMVIEKPVDNLVTEKPDHNVVTTNPDIKETASNEAEHVQNLLKIKQNPFLIPIVMKKTDLLANFNDREQSENDVKPEAICGYSRTVIVPEQVYTEKTLELTTVKVEKSPPAVPSVEGKENNPPEVGLDIQSDLIPAQKPSKKNVSPVGELMNGRLDTIIEDLEIGDEIASATKNRLKYMSQGSLTPRRSRRLAAMHEKISAFKTDDVPQSDKDKAGALADELSLLNVAEKTTGYKEDQIKSTPAVKETRKSRFSMRNGKKDVILQDCLDIISLDPISTDVLSTPNRPLTRQQRKISLLGSPQIPSSNTPRKSIRGDLMTFSPLS